MTIWKHTRVISLLIPEELLAMVDAGANKHYMSRSDYIRQVLKREVIADGLEPVSRHDESGYPNPAWLDINDS